MNATITATFTWDGGPDHVPAPTNVVRVVYETANYTNIGSAGSCKNDFGDPVTANRTPYGQYTGSVGFDASGAKIPTIRSSRAATR